MSITAPYNFVPLNKEVFYPTWSEDVSHDIPFADGQSGEITIKITAESPIFVRNHSDDKEEKSSEFCNYKGRYFIPATSIKGVLRTLVEVMSFSKLQLQDKRLAYRDLNHLSYKKKAMDTNKIYMGWMHKEGNDVIIESLGRVTNGETRIKYKDMKKHFDNALVSKLQTTKEAFRKYALFKGKSLDIGGGTIVFTGSTGKQKTREFLFPNKKPEQVYRFSIDCRLFQTFLHSYYIGTPNESKDWKNLWSRKFKNEERIPVFFQLDNEGNIKHFGLSMLYKLPYENTLLELLKNYQDHKERADFAQTLFGYVDEKSALKGRVYFSNFYALKAQKYKSISLPLSTPRATFYPNYLVQCSSDGSTQRFITYDDENAILRGFKFYPPRRTTVEFDQICKKNPKVCTRFTPLQRGSEFVGKIRFHNLKESEIGALFAAVSFLNNNDCYHKIGMAKAYGFGTVKLSVEGTTLKNDINHYIETFKQSVKEALGIDLVSHPRIKALFKLCSYDSFSDEELRFMHIKGFVNAKRSSNRFVLGEVVPNAYDKSKLPCKKTQKSFEKKRTSSESSSRNLDDLFGGNANVSKPKRSGLKIVKKGKRKE